MSELIAFHIYRTETLQLNREKYIVHFTKRNDLEEYALFAKSESSANNWRCFYSPEIAADFKRSTGRELEEEVYAVLKGDIERGLV
jgi:hypothetical protein